MAIVSQRYDFNSPTIVQVVPQTAGVYALYDGNGYLIYYGRSDNDIRSRLLSHLAGNEGRCTQAAASFNIEITQRAISREKELLEEFKRTSRQTAILQ
jgi:GIY-YIG catalytic domain.